jgi:PAS domain S-box-containing protein
MKTLNLERNVLAGFIAASMAFMTLAALTWNFTREALSEKDFATHTQEVLAGVHAIETDLYRAEAGQRAYLISGKQPYLDDRNVALGLLQKDIQQLVRLAADNARQQARLVHLGEEIKQRIDLFERTARKYEAEGLAAVQLTFGASAPPMERIRPHIEGILEEENRLFKLRRDAASDSAAAAQYGFFGLVALLAIVLPLLYIRVRQESFNRAQSQAALQRLTDVLDSTPDIVAMSDSRSRGLYFNRSARAMLALGDEDATRIDVRTIYPGWAQEKIRGQAIAAAVATGSWSGETAFLSRDGKEIPVSQVIISHRQHDGTISLSTIARSIAERKKAEELAEQAAKYTASAAKALTLYNTHADREQVLEGTLNILADNHPFPVTAFYAYDEWGGNLRLSAAHGAPAGTRTLIKLGEGLVGEAARSMRLIRIDYPDTMPAGLSVEAGFGNVTPAALLFSPVTYQKHLLGVLALAATEPVSQRELSFVEILSTQLGAALHTIKQLDDMRLLTEQLRIRSEEITTKNKQLEEASRMKSEFLANMSHELRTPLNAIIGFSEVIMNGLTGPVNAEQEQYLSDVLSSGHHLLTLINDILDLSKVESGYTTLHFELTDPATLVATGLAMLRERSAARHVTLSSSIEPGLEKLYLDPRRTRQIVYNLMSNAVKFASDGGPVDISLQRVPRARIESMREGPDIRLFPPLDKVCDDFLGISVSDTGIGIGAEDMQRLFEPFIQIDSSYSRKHDGTGLGLALVRKLVELHGGGLMLQSAPDKGSRFTVWLPWRDLPLAGQEALAPEPAINREPGIPALDASITPAILLVEDEPAAARLMRTQLEADGYRVTHALDAETGLKLAAEMRPDAIVLDIVLPGMDGWDMLARIKQDPATSAIPVVIVSITDDTSHGFALGASQVLTKPVSSDELLAALATVGLMPPNGEKILIADDDPKAVSLVSIHLKAAGFVPVAAYGGREAIEMAISNEPALVVLDLMMPDVSGFDVVRALRTHPDTSDVPIVILTAKMLTLEDRASLNGKVQRIIEKTDFDPAALNGEVKRALAKRWQRKKSV